ELVMQLYWLIFPRLTNQRIVQERLAIYNYPQLDLKSYISRHRFHLSKNSTSQLLSLFLNYETLARLKAGNERFARTKYCGDVPSLHSSLSSVSGHRWCWRSHCL